MFNISEFVSSKTGTVLFLHKDGQYYCSESWQEAYKKIFKSRGTIEYINLNNDYSTTRVSAHADSAKHTMFIHVPVECGNIAEELKITYSVEGGLSAERVSIAPSGSNNSGSSNNDGSNSEYIQPEWGYKEEIYLPETEVTFEPMSLGDLEGVGGFVTYEKELVEDTVYIVNYDGVDYDCHYNGFTFGNMVLTGDSNTGEPFMGIADPSMGYGFIPINQTPGKAKVSVRRKVIVPIENEYVSEIPYLDLVSMGLEPVEMSDQVNIDYDSSFYEARIKPKLSKANLKVRVHLKYTTLDIMGLSNKSYSTNYRDQEVEVVLQAGMIKESSHYYYAMVDVGFLYVCVSHSGISAILHMFKKTAFALDGNVTQ